jgi:hypothetical protein
MDSLSFINTNKGIAAVRRHNGAENLYFSQVWFRSESGEWKRYHIFSRENDSKYSSGLLESIYEYISKEKIPFEDWW